MNVIRALRLTLPLVCMVGCWSVPAHAADRQPVLVAEGVSSSWPLTALDQRRPVTAVRMDSKNQRYDVRFRLPPGVRNGHPVWYLLRMDVTAHFRSKATGKAAVMGEMNGFTGARIDMDATAGEVDVDSLSLVGGRREYSTSSRNVTEHFINYAQDGGLLPGRVNVLTFRIETSGAGLESLDLALTSGLELTRADPKEVGLGLPPKGLVAAVGESIELPFGLNRRGGYPDGPVTVEAKLPAGVEAVGVTKQRFDRIGEGAQGKFVIKAQRPGEYQISFRAVGQYNPVAGHVVVAAGNRAPSQIRWWLIVVVAVAAIAFVVKWERRVGE